MLNINIKLPVVIDNIYYKQVQTTDIQVGDLVLDLIDCTYGYCDMRLGDRIAIKQDYVIEVAVPISRVRKLVMIPSPLQAN